MVVDFEVSARPYVFRKNRHEAQDQGQFPVRVVLVIDDGRRVGSVHPGNLGIVVSEVGAAVLPQHLQGKYDVGRGHGPAIREFRSFAQLECDGGKILFHIDRFRQQAIQGERLCPVSSQQAFEHQRAHAGRRLAPDDERVGAVETAGNRLLENAALGRIRVDVRKVGEVSRQRRFPMHGNAMLWRRHER